MNDMTRRRALKAAAATGLTVAVGSAVAAQDQRPADRWRAWAITGGDQTRLTVEGIYSQGGPGLVAIVTPAEPQGINPRILLLQLRTATLPGVWPTVLVPIPAHYTQSPYAKGQYDSVQVLYPDSYSVGIDTIVDAGDGPEVGAAKIK